MTPEEKRAAFPITLPLNPFYKLFSAFWEPVEVLERLTSTYLRHLKRRFSGSVGTLSPNHDCCQGLSEPGTLAEVALDPLSLRLVGYLSCQQRLALAVA